MAKKYIDESKIMHRVFDLTLESKRMLPPIKGFENQPLVSLEKSIEPLVSLVPDVEQMAWIVKENCQNPHDGLSSDESGAIMLYTLEWEPSHSSFYFILNSTLRTEHRQKLRPWFLYLRLIIFALSKLPSISQRIIYRGINLDMSNEFIKDKKFIWWSFSSCTFTIESIKHFLGEYGPRTILNIESNSAKDITQHSFYKTENEILLYPARQFQVISSINTGNQLHIIQLKEIQTPFPLIHIPQTTSSEVTTVRTINYSYYNQKLKGLIDKCEHHSEISLSVQELTDEDMNIVVEEAIVNKQCTNLSLRCNLITSVGTSVVAKGLCGNTTLELLILSHNAIGDIGIQFLAKVLSLDTSSLRDLDLAATGITNEGIKYLAEMLKTNSTLFFLNVSHNKIGDQGIKLLTNVLIHHNKTIKNISLYSNKSVTDSSVDSVVEMLQKNSSLNYLTLSGCDLSVEGKKQLQQAAATKARFGLLV